MKANASTISVLSDADVQGIEQAAAVVVKTHQSLSEFLAVGQTLAEIDLFVAETIHRQEAKSCFLGYRIPKLGPFPSHACLSLNECVVHGHAQYYTEPLKPGDVLKIDIGVRCRGWIGDAAWTYTFGEPTEEVQKLTHVGKESIRRGVEQLQPGKQLVNWARIVQEYVEEEQGLHLIRGFGGHGIGKKLHLPPFIANTVPRYGGEWPDAFTHWQPGMVVAVEPMIAVGTGATRQESRQWPVYTADGSQSVHYEHDVLITADGPRVLTAELDTIEDVIDR